MTYEAVKIELTNGTGNPRRFTCADSALTKGVLLKLTDPRTCAAVAAEGDVIAGIASMDKVVDGSLAISLWTDGIFEMHASGAIAVGAPVKAAGADSHVKALLGTEASGAACIGYALETAADKETLAVRVRL